MCYKIRAKFFFPPRNYKKTKEILQTSWAIAWPVEQSLDWSRRQPHKNYWPVGYKICKKLIIELKKQFLQEILKKNFAWPLMHAWPDLGRVWYVELKFVLKAAKVWYGFPSGQAKITIKNFAWSVGWSPTSLWEFFIFWNFLEKKFFKKFF